MVGRVFISCGQRSTERNIAEKIAKLLQDEFKLDSYLAFKIQGLHDVMRITDELRASDYYLFVDFHRKDHRRKNGTDLPISLFTHQELALAHHVGFRDMIALQEKGTPLAGVLKYVLSNPEHFRNEKELLEKVRNLVRERKWSKDFSRNLVLEGIEKHSNPIGYADHTGQHMEFVWHATVKNRRPDVAAVNAVCVLDSIEYPDGTKENSHDRSYLKWAGHSGYTRTILPEDYGVIDLFAVHADEQGVYLHSALDMHPRSPILNIEGTHKLRYRLYSEGFPLLPFCVEVDYHHSSFAVAQWENITHAKLVS